MVGRSWFGGMATGTWNVTVYQYSDLVTQPELLYRVPQLPEVSSGFTPEQAIEPQLTHMAIGDVDHDGLPEVVLAGTTYYAVVGVDADDVEFEWVVPDVASAEFRGGVREASQPPNLLFIARSGEPERYSQPEWCTTCRQRVMRIPLTALDARGQRGPATRPVPGPSSQPQAPWRIWCPRTWIVTEWSK